jgi:hypothetical protein
MRYLKRYNESSEERINFNSFLSRLDDLKAICDGQLATLYDEGFSLDYQVTRTTYPKGGLMKAVSPCLYIQLDNDETKVFTWDQVKDSFIPLLQLLSRRYEFLPYFDTRTSQLKMRQEAREKIMLSTQVCFQKGYNNNDFTYVSLQDVINDSIGIYGGIKLFSIGIKIGGEL